MGHTPGAWSFMNDSVFLKRAYGEAAPGITIGCNSNTEPICRVSGYLMPLEDNARLIAASPDLLAACEAALAELMTQYPDGGQETINQLEAAIAKARG